MKRMNMKYLYAILSLYSAIVIAYLITDNSDIKMLRLSTLVLVLCCAFYCWFKHVAWMQNGSAYVSPRLICILAVFLSAATIMGVFLDRNIPLEKWGGYEYVSWMLCVGGILPLWHCLIRMMFSGIEWLSKRKKTCLQQMTFKYLILCWGIITCIILLCWLPVWLAYYPGLWNYDPWQVSEYLDKSYSKFHPLIHTLLLGKCYAIGVKLNDPNLGVILYDWVQMVIMSSIFSYTVLFVYARTRSRITSILTITFYSLLPIHSILAISSTKDTIFAGLMLLTTVLAIQYYDKGKYLLPIKSYKIMEKFLIGFLLLSTVIMLLFRNNAVYAYVCFLVVGACLTIVRKIKKSQLLMVVVCFILYIGTDIALTNMLHAQKGSIGEVLSVTSQQFGRIYNCDGLDDEVIETINYYYDTESMQYNQYLADSVKFNLQNITDMGDLILYIRESIKLFIQYTRVSIDSYLYLTQGIWYLGDTSHAEIYGSGLESRQGYLLTDVKNGFGISHVSKFPQLEMFMENTFSANDYQNWSILSLLFSPAFYVWFFVLTFFAVRSNEKYILSFFICYLGTVLLGPCCLIRYVYPFVVIAPVMVAMLLTEGIYRDA